MARPVGFTIPRHQPIRLVPIGACPKRGRTSAPRLPHASQTKRSSISDSLTSSGQPWLKAYEKLRIERTSRIQAVARDTGRFYRAEYENASERDRLMGKWMSAAGWIRGHDAEQIAEEALLLASNDEAIE